MTETPVVSRKNTCGSCTMCCKLPGVQEIAKPVNRWCVHCNIGKGCGIYADRPPSCQSYQCGYLSSGLADFLRPDRCGFILEGTSNENVVMFRVAPEKFSGIWRTEIAMSIIGNFMDRGLRVMVSDGTKCHAFVSNAPGRWTMYEGKFIGMAEDAHGFPERRYTFEKVLYRGQIGT